MEYVFNTIPELYLTKANERPPHVAILGSQTKSTSVRVSCFTVMV